MYNKWRRVYAQNNQQCFVQKSSGPFLPKEIQAQKNENTLFGTAV
jgi:hypothetical protein